MHVSALRICSRLLAVFALIALSSGCVTSRIENMREGSTGIEEGESVVIMAKSYHLGNETEASYIACVEDALGRGKTGLNLSLIHISEPTRLLRRSRMPSSA